MKNNRGFTFIEVIIALALIGIITVGFVSATSNYFGFFNRTKEISQGTFETQGNIEDFIDEIKTAIREKKEFKVGDELDIDNKKLKVLQMKGIWKKIDSRNKGADIRYFEIVEDYNNKTYATLITDYKTPIEDQLKISDIQIEINNNNIVVPYAYSINRFKILGKYQNFYDDKNSKTKYDHLANTVEWYVSDEKFNMPMPDDENLRSQLLDDVLEVSYYYPVFPNDYTASDAGWIYDQNFYNPNYGETEFPEMYLKEYKGRHIVYVVTPGSKSGRIGELKASNPVFISGLPIINNLVAHLDASFIGSNMDIDTKKTNEIETIKENNINKRYINRWNDISSEYKKISGKYDFAESANPRSKSDITNKPQLFKTKMDEPFIGQFVNFTDENQVLNLNSQGTNGKNIYVFAAIRSNKELDENDKSFRDIYKEPIMFLKNGIHHEIAIPIIPEMQGGKKIEIEEGQWIIVKKEIKTTKQNPTSKDFQIGGSNVDIAEIAVYDNRPTNKDGETFDQQLLDYFLTKYKTNLLIDDDEIMVIK